ncbi:hypothetical protein BGX27_005377 [Mortierella sp. AM989]|nr:hypothetical protein BGX27_005377 [Mortierella sp. AM989]
MDYSSSNYFKSVREFNVVLLGETQAGKSTFVQAVRKYADPDCQMDESAIGNGVISCTNQVDTYIIPTDLPVYEAVVSANVNGRLYQEKVNYSEFPNTMDVDDYEDELNERKKYTIIQRRSDEETQFNLYDTPGLNDTNGNDEIHVANIFDKIKDSRKIHLVLVMVGKGPFSPSLRSAIRCYLDLFPQFGGIMAFVHTKVDYKDLHPSDMKFKSHMEEKMRVIHSIMGRSSFPHFWIDCNLKSNKPIRNCITQNTIRKILKVAMLNQPVSLKGKLMNKTPKMKETDSLVRDKYEGMSRVMEETLRFKNTMEGDTLANITSLETEISNVKSEKRRNQIYIEANNTDELELLDEIRHEEDWKIFYRISGKTVYIREQDYVIDHMDLLKHGLKEIDIKGGEGEKFWEMQFKRNSLQNCAIHAKAYSRRRNKYRSQISTKLTRNIVLDNTLQDLKQKRRDDTSKSKEQRKEIEGLVRKNDSYLQLVGIAKEEMIKPEVFRQLALSGAYLGSPDENVQRVVKVYTEVLQGDRGIDDTAESIYEAVDNSMSSDDDGYEQ